MTDNPWKDAVINALTIRWGLKDEHWTDPKLAVADLLMVDNLIALNPLVSSDAAALIEQGRLEERQAWLDHLEGKQIA
jgi:hypothetical protein